jgi:PLP dependent protein
MNIADNLQQIQRRIAAACARSGRGPGEVRLVAVSKRKPAAAIEAAAAAGQLLFGENYVQEFSAKCEAVQAPVSWHFIGALQSNKVKYLCGRVALIHSVDRLSLAEEIDRQWGKLGRPAEILLQVNLSGEETKAGTDEAHLLELFQAVSRLPFILIRGLMTLPPYLPNAEAVRPYFRRLRELGEKLAPPNGTEAPRFELSMGMSHDFEVAIEEGATLVRVGTAIFGERD